VIDQVCAAACVTGTRQGADELADVIFQSISSQPSKDEVDMYHVCSRDSFLFFVWIFLHSL
jgi:hypothetical protein